MRWIPLVPALTVALFVSCDSPEDRPIDREPAAAETAERRGVATARASGDATLSREELEAGRLDDSWRQYTQRVARGAASDPDPDRPDESGEPGERGEAAEPREAGAADESWEDISVESVNGPANLPVSGDVQGPSVAKVQIILNRARFSPGIIDGRWGKNTEKAVYWFQDANGLPATGEVDRQTVDRLTELGGGGQEVRAHQVTEQDVSGPFVTVPDDVYDRADLDCLCYESVREKLGEVFHSSPELLEQLNPGVDLNAVSAGDELNVPAVEPFHADALPEGRYTGGEEVRRIVVSGGGHYVQAFDGADNLLYHFPSTLGADYAPSPQGEFSVESVTFDPTWHYQPELLTGVDPERDDAVLPGGPNNDVGVVWMALSKPHYGIHGTKAPETIGYVTSSGCVRLTNWDAAFLAQRVPEGVPVEFIDVEGRDG